MIKGGWTSVQGDLFRRSYRRAKRAVAAGYYLEAVSLCESLILNRLEVVLRASGGLEFPKYSVGKALNTFESHKLPAFDPNLIEESKAWSVQRIHLSHHFTRVDLDNFVTWRGRLASAKLTVLTGLELANRWSKESRKHKF
jgi:hypothetical protein